MPLSKHIRLIALRKINEEDGTDFITLRQYLKADFTESEIKQLEYWILSETKFIKNNKSGSKILNDAGLNELIKMEKENLNEMSSGQKIHKILEYVIRTKPDQFGWELDELTLAFDDLLSKHELQYLCQQLIDNGDAVDCSSKDGFCICIDDRSKGAYYGKKYLKANESIVNITTGDIGTIQKNYGTVHGSMSQSSDSSSNKSTIEPKQISKKPISIKTIVKFIFWVLGAVLTVYGIYELILELKK